MENSALDSRVIQLTLAPESQAGSEDVDFAVKLISSTTSSSSSTTPSSTPLPFDIDTDGYLYVVGELDRESVSRYNLSVTATRRVESGGHVPQFGEASVVVSVLDENDEGPVLDEVVRTVRELERT